MKSIRTDLGTEYRNDLMKELCNLMKNDHKFSPAYHYETGCNRKKSPSFK